MSNPSGIATSSGLGTETRLELETSWRVTKLAARLGFIAVAALVAALVTGHAELVVVAMPGIGALAVAVHQRKPAGVTAVLSLSESRCFEGDSLIADVRIDAHDTFGEIDVELSLPPGFELVDTEPRQTGYHVSQFHGRWTIRPSRWGRWTVGPVRIRVRSKGLAYVETLQANLGELTVFPPAARAQDIAVPPVLLARIGTHVARRAGAGTEFAEVRTYAPGDPVRRINWPVSTRRSELYVNSYLADRSADVVAIVDSTVDLGPWGRSTLDISVRGAAAVVQAYLRYADRVGVVALGGLSRWLSPDVGTKQYYRIVEALLAARRDDSLVDPDLMRLPRQALPPGALVFVFSPLVDARAIEAIRDLCERGYPVVVVDVLTTSPSGGSSPEEEIALRIWRLDREVLLHGLIAMGVTVVEWSDETGVPLERTRLEPFLRGSGR